MARVQLGGLITDIKGSVAGWTFHANSSGLIVRSRSGTGKSGTPKQFLARQTPNEYASLWQALTLTEQASWNTFAAAHTRTTPFGTTKTITGYNWFQSINWNLLSVGSSFITSAPSYTAAVAVTSYTLSFTATTITLTFGSSYNPANSGILVWTTSPLTRVSASLRSSFRSTLISTATPFTSIDITSAWESTHGLTWSTVAAFAVFNIGTMVQSIEKTSGIASTGLIVVSRVSGLSYGIGSMRIGSTFIVG